MMQEWEEEGDGVGMFGRLQLPPPTAKWLYSTLAKSKSSFSDETLTVKTVAMMEKTRKAVTFRWSASSCMSGGVESRAFFFMTYVHHRTPVPAARLGKNITFNASD